MVPTCHDRILMPLHIKLQETTSALLSLGYIEASNSQGYAIYISFGSSNLSVNADYK